MQLRNIIPTTFLFFVALFCFALANGQRFDYDAHWKKVTDLENKGLPKSALAEVQNIYRYAKKANNDPQVIKSLLFRIRLDQGLVENAAEKNIDSLNDDIAKAKQPAKSILESIAAQLYWNYLQQNRYKLYQRTNTAGFDKKDVATWTVDDLNKKISELYVASLQDEKVLQTTNIDRFDAVILKGNVRYLRPTLYDLLANRALEYFQSDESDITRPAYAFEISKPAAFAPAPVFINHRFTTNDSASLHQKALTIYQQLLAFHKDDKNPAAFLDADISRLNFVRQYGVMPNKDALYLAALKNLHQKYRGYAGSAQALFLMASVIFNHAVANKSAHLADSSYSVREAKRLLDSAVHGFPKSEGGINAQNLLKTILRQTINLTTEKVNVPQTPFRTLINYQNCDRVYFRLVVLSKSLKDELKKIYDNDVLFARLTSLKIYKQWTQDLPKNNDFLSHSAEIKVDGLPVGEYAILASADPQFKLNRNPIAAQYFYVSNISFIKNGNKYFLLNRTTGQPLANATVRAWNQVYDYNKREYSLKKGSEYHPDKNGFFQLAINKGDKNAADVRLEVSTNDDHLFLDDYQAVYYNYYRDAGDTLVTDQDMENKSSAKVFLFTDRSIYRPGQTIYFKGIGVTKNFHTKMPILLETKDSLHIVLSDANGQAIDSLVVMLNDYGSCHGTFKVPENKLNGEYVISVSRYKNSSVDFSVEEYKRPKFYSSFEKVPKSFRIGDTVSLTGFAKAYAGNNIDGAKVSYRVTRVTRFLYPWIFWRKPFPIVSPMEIAHGESTTDADGKFMIAFPAIPDLRLNQETDPVFDYKVQADVTDINGETRSAEIIVPIGYKALNLQVEVGSAPIEIDSFKTIFISSKNLSDQPETVDAAVKIFRLQSPQRLIRHRLWEAPDEFVLSKKEFLRYFPNDEYQEEIAVENWPVADQIVDTHDSTNRAVSITSNYRPGWYKIEATARDRYGKEVKDVRYFELYDARSDSLPYVTYLFDYVKNTNLQPGDTAKTSVGTSAKQIFLIREVNKLTTATDDSKQTNTFDFASLNTEKKNFDYPIKEHDLGGFGVNYFFVKDNRFYYVSDNIAVPWSNKSLNISFATYRDKVLPGSEEKWKVTISGEKGKKVAAEMLASMYDASLDQFKPHSWTDLAGIWPTFFPNESWQGTQNFTTINSFEKYWNEEYIQQNKEYDMLNYLPIYRLYSLNEVVANGYRQKVAAAPVAMEKRSVADNILIKGAEPGVLVDSAGTGRAVAPQPIDQSQIQVRKNFNETAFFYPDLKTDSDGNVVFAFTMPEALTKWKLMTLAHTKDLSSGYAEKTIVTQKELMIQPNTPRFFRQGDQVFFSAKISNLSEREMSGQAELHFLNAETMQIVDNDFKNDHPRSGFNAAAGQSTVVTFSLNIPVKYNDPVIYRIVAKSGSFSDGEEAVVPIVTNRMLVTESLPLPMRGAETKNFKFEKLLQSASSHTLDSYALTFEFTSNPAWYAVQALPYLSTPRYDCAEEIFNSFYANALAQKIVAADPRIKQVFEKWRLTDTAALLSNLQKNEELKSVLLQETPWVLDAKSEEQQKKNIALLFDLVKAGNDATAAILKLDDMQSANGGFVWFKGGPDNRFITQYIVTGIGHLKNLGALPVNQQIQLKAILDKAMSYLDKSFAADFAGMVKKHSDTSKNQLSGLEIQYLYARSFFPEYPMNKETRTAFNYYISQSKKYWVDEGKYLQGMIALALNRSNNLSTAKSITRSLKENAIINDELGMYWKEFDRPGYWWYQAPIESQSLMIEAFSEIENDMQSVADMKMWLLKNKQTNNWKTTIATADACYALLLQGANILGQEKTVTIDAGDLVIKSDDQQQEAGTGYFKKRIEGAQVKPGMGNIKVMVGSKVDNKQLQDLPSWGAAYWQYFEDLDKITFAETPLKLSKKLFVEKNTDNGPLLIPVKAGDQLHVGDKIKVRIELRADRDMEYVHMKDMRAACMEPVNVLSGYKFQDGLGYYETTKDVSTSFFFAYLPKGTYVFEFALFVSNAGNFSNGITTIQCMYAPEFMAHSEGVRVQVAKSD